MTLLLAPATYDALEDLASSWFDRALVLSRYAGGPMCVNGPCLALVVDDVGQLVQFVLLVAAHARFDDELYQLTFALRSGGVRTYQHTWTGGQTVYYWPNVHVRD